MNIVISLIICVVLFIYINYTLEDFSTTSVNTQTASSGNTQTASSGNTQTASSGNTQTAASSGNVQTAASSGTQTAPASGTQTAPASGNTQTTASGNTQTTASAEIKHFELNNEAANLVENYKYEIQLKEIEAEEKGMKNNVRRIVNHAENVLKFTELNKDYLDRVYLQAQNND